MLTRRRFLATAACSVGAARLHAQGQSRVRVAFSIPKEATGPHMPIDFVGLSYEVQQLADPSFFSAQNSGLIHDFKALSSTGVLRLGGNTSEFAYRTTASTSSETKRTIASWALVELSTRQPCSLKNPQRKYRLIVSEPIQRTVRE
jgi:hypothetical protein